MKGPCPQPGSCPVPGQCPVTCLQCAALGGLAVLLGKEGEISVLGLSFLGEVKACGDHLTGFLLFLFGLPDDKSSNWFSGKGWTLFEECVLLYSYRDEEYIGESLALLN